jgi:hypothetical protein
MADTKGSPTKVLFDSLAKLYKQGQLLLMDADRLMGERGWEPMHTTAPAEMSNSLNSPERWYARWAVRFYTPTVLEREEGTIDRLLFVSIHFASDSDTNVDEPIVSPGRLLYGKPMNKEAADASYDYWMCESYFWSKPHETLVGWQCWDGPGRWVQNLKRIETFKVPLYDITSSEKLKTLVIDRLLALEEEGRGHAI